MKHFDFGSGIVDSSYFSRFVRIDHWVMRYIPLRVTSGLTNLNRVQFANITRFIICFVRISLGCLQFGIEGIVLVFRLFYQSALRVLSILQSRTNSSRRQKTTTLEFFRPSSPSLLCVCLG